VPPKIPPHPLYPRGRGHTRDGCVRSRRDGQGHTGHGHTGHTLAWNGVAVMSRSPSMNSDASRAIAGAPDMGSTEQPAVVVSQRTPPRADAGDGLDRVFEVFAATPARARVGHGVTHARARTYERVEAPAVPAPLPRAPARLRVDGAPRKAERPLCGARCRSRDGAPCRARVVVDRDARGRPRVRKRCRMHGGLSTGPKTAEGWVRTREGLAWWRARQSAAVVAGEPK